MLIKILFFIFSILFFIIFMTYFSHSFFHIILTYYNTSYFSFKLNNLLSLLIFAITISNTPTLAPISCHQDNKTFWSFQETGYSILCQDLQMLDISISYILSVYVWYHYISHASNTWETGIGRYCCVHFVCKQYTGTWLLL